MTGPSRILRMLFESTSVARFFWFVLWVVGSTVVIWILNTLYPSHAVWTAPLLLLVGGASVIQERRRRRQQFKQAESADFRCCPVCQHDLGGLSAEGRCPECGAPYTPQSLQTAWRRNVNVRPQADGECFRPLNRATRRRWLEMIAVVSFFAVAVSYVFWLANRVIAGTFRTSDLLWILLLPVAAFPQLFAGSEPDHMAYLGRHRFRHCPRCHRSLSKRRNSGVCAKCRLPWDGTWLEATWRHVYAEQRQQGRGTVEQADTTTESTQTPSN